MRLFVFGEDPKIFGAQLFKRAFGRKSPIVTE